jgi:hypothetical protein
VAELLSITFTREELVVLADTCGLRLLLLGDRPLAHLPSAARGPVLDGAKRSLLARGVVARTDDPRTVRVVRAASALLEIVANPALVAEVVVTAGGPPEAGGGAVRSHTIAAVPHAAVEVTSDDAGNLRFTPFATPDLLLRVAAVGGLVAAPAAPGAGGPGGLPGGGAALRLPWSAWAAARAAAPEEPGAAGRLLAEAVPGVAVADRDALVGALRTRPAVVGVQVRHHPTPTTTAGGEAAWLDGGAAGWWSIPAHDQPFARPVSNPFLDERAAGDASSSPDLGELPVIVARVDPAMILPSLVPFLPAPG